MSNENELIASDAASTQLPAFMQEDTSMGKELLRQFVVPPRIVVVQPLSNAPLDKYDAGTVLIMPNEQLLTGFDKAEKGSLEPFIAVPLFFFVEYTLDNPREIAATKGAVRERTFDPNSEIAVRAQNPKLREAPCPDYDKKPMTYVTRLNYIIQIMREDCPMPIVVTFKKGEFRSGMAFNSLITARKCPIFGAQYMFDVGYRENEQGKWYGFDVSNPPKDVGGWVTNEELYNTFKKAHLELAAAHEAKLIQIDYSEEGDAQQPEPEM